MSRRHPGFVVPPATERLVFRPLAIDDAPVLFQALTDPYASRFYRAIVSAPRDAVLWIERQLTRYEREGVGLFGLEIRSGELIGDCGLIWQQIAGRRELEVGYHVHPAHRRRGYATEAARACLRHGFATQTCARIVSLVHPDNVASQRVAERVHARATTCVWQHEPYLLYVTEREAAGREG